MASAGGGGGRFLKEDPVTGAWVEIGDERAVKKTGQALRESAPELRAEKQARLMLAAATAAAKASPPSGGAGGGRCVFPPTIIVRCPCSFYGGGAWP